MALELSLDLVEEILSWVPAGSLLRLRCTCKQWETLIAKPWFVKKHLSHTRCREQQFTVFYNEYEHGVSSSLGSVISYVGIDFKKQVKYDLKMPFPAAFSQASSISHCDGLMLYVSTKSMFWVLNPMFEQKTLVKYSRRYDHSTDVFGLGYITNQSSSSYDYKVVRFGCGGRTEGSSRVEVYAFKSDSWKFVVDKNFDGFSGLPMSSVCLRGTPYWLGHKKGGNNLTSIQSFDFLKERFESLFLPPPCIESCNLDICQSLGIFRGEQLSLLLLCYKTLKIHLWVMKKQQWSRQMTVNGPHYPMNPKYSFIERNARLALFVKTVGSSPFLTKTGRITIFIVGENQKYQEIGYFTGPGPFCDSCYVPSLLQVPGIGFQGFFMRR